MLHTFTITSRVTDTTDPKNHQLYFRSSNTWGSVDDAKLAILASKVQSLGAAHELLKTIKGGKKRYDVELAYMIDDGTPVVVSYAGISHKALVTAEKLHVSEMQSLVDMGDALLE